MKIEGDILITYILIVVILALILIFYAYIFNHFQYLLIKITEAETNINSALNKKFDLLNRSIAIIKANTKINKEILENIIKLRSRKINDFELDKELDIAEIEFNTIKQEHISLKEIDNFAKLHNSLTEANEQLLAAKLYYNDYITKYNKLIRYFPSNIIAKIFNFKEKSFHENIDLYINNSKQ